MTLDDLASLLPNGFHDALLKVVTIDYVNGRARLLLDIWIGEGDAGSDAEREARRRAEVVLSGLIFWVCEAPRTDRRSGDRGGLMIDIGAVATLAAPPSAVLPPAPAGCSVNWIFVHDWNAFIYVAAHDAQLIWLA